MLVRLHPFARLLPALLALVLVACGGSTASPSAAPTVGQPANQIPQRQPATMPVGTSAPAAAAPTAAAAEALQPIAEQPAADVAAGTITQRPTAPPAVEPVA